MCVLDNEDDLADFTVEIDILSECRHPNVVELHEAYFIDNKLWMLLEYCDGGALDSVMSELEKGLSESQIAYVCREMCRGLEFLHSRKVIHRDLKAGNVLATMAGESSWPTSAYRQRTSRRYRSTTRSSGRRTGWRRRWCETFRDNPYDFKVKVEEDEKYSKAPAHVLSVRGLGCGLLLDWLSELQRETLGTQMRLMFVRGGASWRPLLVTLLAHRASWRTLHACLAALLERGGWSASSVLHFAETLIGSPRVWQGRDRATPKHHQPEDSLRLTHAQLDVLIQYVGEEASEAEASQGMEAARRSIEARLPLVLRCCSAPHALRRGACLQAILECLDSNQPEIAQSAVDKLPELVVGMQEHAARVLMKVFELGMKSRLPVEQCIAKCVATINLNRGC